MITVPDAATLPSVPRPMRRSNSDISSGGKPCGNDRKGTLEHQPHQLPVPGDRILAGRGLRHPPVGAARPASTAESAPPRSTTPPETERAKRGHGQTDLAGDVAERVAAAIAVSISVGQLADTHAVEDDEDDPAGNGGMRQARQASCVE